MFYFTLKINFKMCTKFGFEFWFDFFPGAKVDEVINEEVEVDLWFAVDEITCEDAWCVRKRFQANFFEGCFACIVPKSSAIEALC